MDCGRNGPKDLAINPPNADAVSMGKRRKIVKITNKRDKYEILSYECKIGDAIAFNYATIHSAYGNNSNNRRRAFSIRFTGDDARYIKRKGEMSPPFPEVQLKDNDVLDCDTFPILISS